MALYILQRIVFCIKSEVEKHRPMLTGLSFFCETSTHSLGMFYKFDRQYNKMSIVYIQL